MVLGFVFYYEAFLVLGLVFLFLGFFGLRPTDGAELGADGISHSHLSNLSPENPSAPWLQAQQSAVASYTRVEEGGGRAVNAMTYLQRAPKWVNRAGVGFYLGFCTQVLAVLKG